LFHDAGKGMGGDHSRRGAELMARVAERLHLSVRQKEIGEFLVLQHLLMSHTAQRRDLSDPELIADFARRVGDAEKLSCLYLLTYADISSVGPEMWSEWKAQLLAELYQKSRAHLLSDSRPNAEDLVAEARGKFVRSWERRLGKSNAEAFGRALPAHYFLSTDPSRAALHGRLLLRAPRQPLAAFLKHRREAGFSELTLCAADRPGLLAQFAGVLSAHRIDILRARIASTSDGLALDVFDVMAPHGQLVEHARWKAARADLIRVLRQEATVESILERRRASSLLARRLPSVATRISVDNRASLHFTVIDVRAEDRVGLLYAIASSLTGMGLEIALAKVATEAHRAIDSFYVTTTEGEKLLEPDQIEAATSSLRCAIDALTTGSSLGR
jgi:[protein-PII] uridylyltransferase